MSNIKLHGTAAKSFDEANLKAFAEATSKKIKYTCESDIFSKLLENITVTYTVARKKDGEIVGTFDTLEEAFAEIEKARRNKKVALVQILLCYRSYV